MRRIVPAAIAGALVVAACDGGGHHHGGGASFSGYADECQQFSSCSACTPVDGCGWCFDSDGRGMCAASPDECLTPAFSWTWNPSGCRIPADASAVLASPPAPEGDADSTSPGLDAARPIVDGAASTDDASVPPPASALDDAAPWLGLR